MVEHSTWGDVYGSCAKKIADQVDEEILSVTINPIYFFFETEV